MDRERERERNEEVLFVYIVNLYHPIWTHFERELGQELNANRQPTTCLD